MGMFLSAWAGDNAASVIGRLNNTLLVGVTTTDNTKFPEQLLTSTDRAVFPGFSWYFNLRACCLANPAKPFEFPARDAIVIGCTPLPRSVLGQGSQFSGGTNVYFIELAQLVTSDEGIQVPWEPGINLFSVWLPAIDFSGSAMTIATAIIDDKVTILKVPTSFQIRDEKSHEIK